MRPLRAERLLIGAFVALLVPAAPASADVRSVESREGVQFTLSGTELTLTATAKASPAVRRTLQETGLSAFCVSGIADEAGGEMPEGGIAYVVVANTLTPVDGTQRTTFKFDISPTVDVCGVEDADGADLALAGFTPAGRRAAEAENEPPVDRGAERRLERAARAAIAEQRARGGRFPSARRLQRAIVRRTDGRMSVRRARGFSGVRKAGVVYIVGRTRARRLTLATPSRHGILAFEIRADGRGGTLTDKVVVQ